MTDAERALWRLLRGRQLEGHRFPQQEPIDHYIVDFMCFEARLIIEVDGGQHFESDTDKKRDAHLEWRGFRVLRFWNNHVLSNPEGGLPNYPRSGDWTVVFLTTHPATSSPSSSSG